MLRFTMVALAVLILAAMIFGGMLGVWLTGNSAWSLLSLAAVAFIFFGGRYGKKS